VEDNPLAARKNFLSILVMTESRLLLCVTLQPGGSRAVEL